MADTVGINVVFTDLVGSTELSSRLGPEATDALRIVHFGLLRSAVAGHDGREVKNLGDGLMVVFPSLGKAIDGSIAMQQAIDRHNASGKEPLGIRVGISTGDAIEEDDDYFGEPVVESARLCAKCEPGQIIVSQLTSMLARNSGHTFASIGDLELRGIPEPVAGFTVVWAPAAVASTIDVPDRLRPDMNRPIAGRVLETESLAQAWKSASSGERRLTFVAGEPGIGKTRLSAELAIVAHRDGATVLYGRCDEELSVPYQPWIEAISHLTDDLDDATLEPIISQCGPELALLLPNMRRRFPAMAASTTTDPETERYMLLQAVTSCLSLLAEQTPVLLVLDDLHWADKQTPTLLRHLFTNISARSSIMVVVNYRDSDLDAGHPLIDTVAALRREPGVEQLSIVGLDDIEMRQLVEISAERELDESGRRMALLLRQETGGNPFFAHEILRNLVEAGDLYLDGDTWVVKDTFDEFALPQSIRDVVGQRIARLGTESVTALTAAAVIGREFDLALVAAATDTDEDDLLDHFDAAVSAGVLTEEPGGDERFRFVHSLARTTLVAGLSDGRARRMHRRIAEALEALIGDDPGDRVGELATHWMAAAAPIEQEKAIHFAQLAGRRALQALAPDEAIRWFTTAIEHLELSATTDVRLRAELLVELGTAQQHIGEPAFRATLLEAGALAGSVGDTRLMVAAALANNRGLYSKLGETDDQRVAALRAALEAVGADDSAERALLIATLFSELEWDSSLDERTTMITEAVRIARAVGDPWVLGAVLNRASASSLAPHNLAERRLLSAESLEIARRLADRTLEFWANVGVFFAAFNAADRAGADTALAEAMALADGIGRPSFRWFARALRTSLLIVVAHPDEAEASAHETFQIGTEAGEPDAFDYFAAALMMTRFVQGRGMEVMDLLRTAVDDHPQLAAYRASLASGLAEEGYLDEARGILTEAEQDGFEIRVNTAWSVTVGPWALAAALVADPVCAAQLYEAFAPFAGQIAATRTHAHQSVDSYLGPLAMVLGNHEQADAHFSEAERVTEAFGAQGFASWNDLWRARHAQSRGNASGARHLAERALDRAQGGIQGVVEREARTLLETLSEG